MRIILLALGGLLLLTACQTTEVNGITSRTGDEEHPPQLDLEAFDGCTIGELGWVKGNGTIVNNGIETSTYEVVVGFSADNARLDQATTWIRDLRVGERAAFEAAAFLGDRAPTVDDCSVITINRL